MFTKTFQELPHDDKSLNSLIELISDWYWEQDSEFRFTHLEGRLIEGGEGLVGENPIGKRPWETGLIIVGEGGWDAHRTLLEARKPFRDVVMQWNLPDGAQQFISLIGEPVFDDQGRFTGYRGIGKDVTDQQKREQEVAEFRATMDVSPDMIFIVDRDTMSFLYVNETVYRLSGYTREEFMNLKPYDFLMVRPENLEHAYDELVAAGPEGIRIEMRTRTKDGTPTIIELHRRALRLGDRWVIVSISHDISRRFLDEEAIQQQRRMYTALSVTNESIMHARSPMELFQRVCDAVVNGGKFLTAAVFLPDPPNPWMRVAAAAGIGVSKLQQLRIALDETIPEGIGLISTAFRTCRPCIAKDNLNDEGLKSGLEGVQKARVAAAVPLLRDGLAVGVLFFRSEERRAFNDEVVKLFERIAENVVFGLDNIEHEAKRKQMEEELRQSEERYRTIIEAMEEWYFETDLTGNILFFNDAITRALGYPQKNLTGLNFRTFFTPEEADMLYETFHRVYETGEPIKNFPYRLIQPDGNIIFAEVSIFSKRDQEGKIIGFRVVGHDLTELKRNEERFQYLATHDALTGLPNRLLFGQLLNHALQSARRYNRELAVFFIDLDRFKMINDTLGHDAGDQLLREIARRLDQVLREIDIVARLGGDEYVVLIEEVTEQSQIITVAQKILSAVIKPIVLKDHEYRITASIGISMYPRDGLDEQSLMKNADIAMYLAKEEGKNNFQFYNPNLKSRSFERLTLETNLREALERDEFSLHYQAKLNLKTNAITGVEALIRWQNPALGAISPMQFIPVAEETGLIIPIGRWVLKTACAQNVVWQDQGLPKVCMAVNLSMRQLMDDNLMQDIRTALQDSGLAPNLLELEITESMLMQNPERIIRILTEIKNLGIRLAIDDFGTGYSSLAQIRHFPIDTLKVDRSFIHDLSKNSEDKTITEAIIAMGKTLSLTVVAEGVETEEQDAFLRSHACDEMQGYYFSKPTPPDQFAELLQQHVPVPKQTGK